MLFILVETISEKLNLQMKVFRDKYIYSVTPPTVLNYYQLWGNERAKKGSNSYKHTLCC